MGEVENILLRGGETTRLRCSVKLDGQENVTFFQNTVDLATIWMKSVACCRKVTLVLSGVGLSGLSAFQ
jgi:hypothetical protein